MNTRAAQIVATLGCLVYATLTYYHEIDMALLQKCESVCCIAYWVARNAVHTDIPCV